jgi:hypothetical protein
VLKSSNGRFSGLNHQNFEFFGLTAKSPNHTGLIYVKSPELNIASLGPFKAKFLIETHKTHKFTCLVFLAKAVSYRGHV